VCLLRLECSGSPLGVYYNTARPITRRMGPMRRSTKRVLPRRSGGRDHAPDPQGVDAPGQHDDKDASSNWRNPPRPAAKAAEQGTPYNPYTWERGGRREVAEGPAVGWTVGNTTGAMGPCCSAVPLVTQGKESIEYDNSVDVGMTGLRFQVQFLLPGLT
jgi:hypothetical protein